MYWHIHLGLEPGTTKYNARWEDHSFAPSFILTISVSKILKRRINNSKIFLRNFSGETNANEGELGAYLTVKCHWGSGFGAVGRLVASDTRGPGFESSHRQLLLNIYLLLTVCRKDENKEKEARSGPFLKKTVKCPFVLLWYNAIVMQL